MNTRLFSISFVRNEELRNLQNSNEHIHDNHTHRKLCFLQTETCWLMLNEGHKSGCYNKTHSAHSVTSEYEFNTH